MFHQMLLANQIALFFKMYYLKKEKNGKVYFRQADKHRSFLQGDNILGACSQACLKYPK